METKNSNNGTTTRACDRSAQQAIRHSGHSSAATEQQSSTAQQRTRLMSQHRPSSALPVLSPQHEQEQQQEHQHQQRHMSSAHHYTPSSQPPASATSTSTTSTSSKSKRASSSHRGGRIPQEVRFGSYVLGTTLGAGEFGKVKLGWRKDGKQPSQAAIKMIKRDSIPTGSDKESKIYREIMALKRLRHPNIVRLVEVLQNDKYIGIVLEYASGGELFEYILNHKYLKESQACRLFAQLISGVDYMHSKGIVHRDLKLENLLLDKHKNIIITDFGFVNSFSNQNNDLMKTSCGSPCYAAPELVVSSDPYEGRKVDVWSCGIILYAMLAGYLPFDDDEENPEGTNIARLYHYITHVPLKFPQYIQPTPRDLLRKIIVSDPNKRISIREIRSHRWLAPHAPFLSVSPMEWDKNYRSSKNLTQQDKINRRMSLMENPTSASLMLNKQTARTMSSQNVQASLYANPAAPQTSKATAIPSAENSPVASPRRINVNVLNNNVAATSAPINNNNSNSLDSNSESTHDYPNNNNNNAKFSGGRHSRSGSTASLVLQAVVDADVEIKRKYSNASSDMINSTPSKPKQSHHHQRPISFIPLLSSDSTVSKNFETIKESPEHSKLSPLLPPDFNTKPSSNIENGTIKLPSSRIIKPRPTSYHPSYTPNSFNSGIFNSPFTPSESTFGAIGNYSDTSLKYNNTINSHNSNRPKINGNGNSTRSYSSTSESLISNNEDSVSSTMSKLISEPHTPMDNSNDNENGNNSNNDNDSDNDNDNDELESDAELENMNDTLTKQPDNLDNKSILESPSKTNKRNSYAMDLLTNAFDSLSMIAHANNESPTKSSKIKATSKSSPSPIASSVSELAQPVEESVQIFKEVMTKEELRKASPVDADQTIYETKDSEKENIDEDELHDTVDQLPSNEKTTTTTTTATSTTTDTKYKRFSLLTFYQSIPGPTASSSYVSNNTSNNQIDKSNLLQSKVISSSPEDNIGLGLRVQHPVSPAIVPQSITTTTTTTKLEPVSPVVNNGSVYTKTRKVSSNTRPSQSSSRSISTNNNNGHSKHVNSNRNSMKPLEPSNLKTDRRVSGLNFSMQDKSDKTDKREERETSTARKVMDFFKRRSMRI